jgi:hypothetical protein
MVFCQDMSLEMAMGARWSERLGKSSSNISSAMVLYSTHPPESHSLAWSVIGLGWMVAAWLELLPPSSVPIAVGLAAIAAGVPHSALKRHLVV